MRWIGKTARHRTAARPRSSGGGTPAAVAPSDVARRFRAAWTGAGDPESASLELLPVRLARACVQVLPVAGASLTLLSDDFRVPLGANDETASFAERLQFTQGEGPCLDASRDAAPVSVTASDIERRWPAFAAELFEHTPYRALVSVPLPLSEENLGALDLYLHTAEDLAAISVADVLVIANQIAATLLHPAFGLGSLDSSGSAEPAWLRGGPAGKRTNVWVAMGILMTRQEVGAMEALALLRAHAYSHDLVVDELASRLIAGQIDADQLER